KETNIVLPGGEKGIISMHLDITERKEIEQELKEKNILLNSILESIQDGIAVLNPDLTIRYTNPTMDGWYQSGRPLKNKKCYQGYYAQEQSCENCPVLKSLNSKKMESAVKKLPEWHELDYIEIYSYLVALHDLPAAVERVLELEPRIAELAERFVDKRHSLFLGRGPHYPVALEGALKLKEISYIHAEAYPAGELKHGPLALVDSEMPVVAVAPNDELLEKLKSNLQEVEARGGELIVFADDAVSFTPRAGLTVIPVPTVSERVAPLVFTVPLQLLAYHVAVLKGTDVDKPRNLAKSVTVE
ncbi:MAG: SIS domain-containing protein, partial [Ectothiorhodospiraceae bacterium]